MQVYPRCTEIEEHIRKVVFDKDLEEAVAEIFRKQWNRLYSPLYAAAWLLEPQSRSTAVGNEVMHLSRCHCGVTRSNYLY